MRHLKKFENFDFQKEEELFVPADVVNNKEHELFPACNCKPCECEEENDEETRYGDENVEAVQMTENKLEKFSTFNEKKKATPTPAQKKAREEFAKRIKGEKSDDKKAPAKKSDAKGKVPETEAEKKLAAKYGDKERITKGDFIKAAIDNKKKKESKEK